MDDLERQHFDRIADRYDSATESSESYALIADRINPLLASKDILDIGNGGLFAYDPALPRRIIAMDISPSMLDRIQDPRVIKRVGDARDLQGIEDRSLDAILFMFSLHHMAGENVPGCLRTLEQILASSARKLRPGGHLILAEPVMFPVVFRIERLLFHAMRFVLNRFGVPMIFMYSLSALTGAVGESFRAAPEEIRCERLPTTGWIDPLAGSFPGVIRIPAWMEPWRYHLLIVPVRPDLREA